MQSLKIAALAIARLLVALLVIAPIVVFSAMAAFEFNGTIYALLITLTGAGVSAATMISIIHA